MAIEKEKFRINFNKPIYIGTNTLDLSKLLIQDFHYNYIETKYGDKVETLMRDTDSLVYKTENENVYEDFCEDNELFDFSNYSKDSK